MWREFWAGLNIRKFIVLILVITFSVVSYRVVSYGITEANTNLITSIVGGVSSVLGVCIGYYFGYSSVKGTSDITKNEKSDKGDNL